jgi:hypothetical protein
MMAAFFLFIRPDISTMIKVFSFNDWERVYRSLLKKEVFGKKERISLIKLMEPLAKTARQKELIKKISKST